MQTAPRAPAATEQTMAAQCEPGVSLQANVTQPRAGRTAQEKQMMRFPAPARGFLSPAEALGQFRYRSD